MREGVADVLGQLGFLRDPRQLGLEPGFERGDDGRRMLASGSETQERLLAANTFLDLLEQRDLPEHLFGDG